MKNVKYKKEGYLILGINGWVERGHDASAALIEVTNHSCKIIAALEEEKVVGEKCAYNRFPVYSIKEILEMTSLKAYDIDEIVFGWDYPKLYKKLNKKFPFSSNQEIIKLLFPFEEMYKQIPVSYIDHHLAHAASTFRTSNFDDALVVVIDGNGEGESCSIWTGKKDTIECIHRTSINSSFGFLFEAANTALGFRVSESGKTMGLAAYGSPQYVEILLEYYKDGEIHASDNFDRICNVVKRISNASRIDAYNCQEILIKAWLLIFKDRLKLNVLNEKPTSYYSCMLEYKNLAASVQTILEEKIVNETKKWIVKTGMNKVCIAGGVGLNCTMNGKILALEEVERIFVQPAAGDAGVSLGSALERAKQLGFKAEITHKFSAYLGAELEDFEIIEYLKKKNIKYKYMENIEDDIAERMYSDEIIALFQGRNEWGPRALGNRSIISRPTKGKLDIINQNVKQRELGRPLAPSMLLEDAGILNEYIKIYCEHMNVAYKAERQFDDITSILHADNTYRPQYVSKEVNSLYYSQLHQIKDKLGSSIIINTSLNNKTPIVYGIKQALELFEQKTLSAMVFNGRIVIENRGD